MFKISPFTPLFFSPSTDRFGIKSKYIQVFAPTDKILVEVIASRSDKEPMMRISHLGNGGVDEIIMNKWTVNENTILYYYIISNLDNGYYSVNLYDMTSEPFKVTNDSTELLKTTLIRYSMKDNKERRDGLFWIDGTQYYFEYRVPGGFKDDGWGFGVSTEQFITQEEDVVELYSHESTQQTFTLGGAIGCPVWFAELLNRVLSCHYVYFDGVRYMRKDNSVPEKNVLIDGIRSYTFTQVLQRVTMEKHTPGRVFDHTFSRVFG